MVREYGSKAAPKMLVKLTTGVDFTNILMEAFMHADPEGAKDTDDLIVFYAFGICFCKSYTLNVGEIDCRLTTS